MVTQQEIKNFPDVPGVYLMKDKEDQVIYVGKALSLKKRVRSYFLKNQTSFKTQIMMGYVHHIDFIRMASEHDALISEARFIKQYKPRFNISLKDDKSFPYIKITREDIPRVFIGRKKKEHEAFDYFGPYTSAKLLRRALAMLRKSFPFCTCRRFPKKVCLNYHMGLCAGPYQKKISRQEYGKIIKGLEYFLLKKDDDLIEELSRQMRAAVTQERFEDAARLRDQLEALSLLVSLKKIDARKVLSVSDDFKALGLRNEPMSIEAFDISNIGGQLAVGSMVSFLNGVPDKSRYRRFKIKTVAGADDYAMISEVVRRRYARLIKENKQMPDLIVIDGGPGQLGAGYSVLKELKLDVAIIAIAKREELIYTVKHKNAIKLTRDSKVLRLIQSLRDEAHRFALKYHHFLRARKTFEA
jgi:excinuclease ABC subunit C